MFLDIIALPNFDNRAMENWGLLMFDESTLLLQPSDELTEKKAVIAYILSHEIGHQACSKMFFLISHEEVLRLLNQKCQKRKKLQCITFLKITEKWDSE